MKLTTCFERQVQEFVEREGLFGSADTLLVALSGGADSVALLRVLLRLGYACHAAHCNFHLRGEESDRDEFFCRTLCQSLGVELHVTHFDTCGYASRQGVSIEMAARELRYGWFDELCDGYGYAHVAVAHHRDDGVETLLLNMVRGTGIAGLTGIRPVNGRVVRPMLGVSREEVMAYLDALGQGFVTDSTNLQDEYVRNKVRLQILPLLEEINPQVREKISSTIRHLRGVEAIYDKAVKEAVARVADAAGRTISIPALLGEVEPQAVLFELLRPYGFVPAQVGDVFRCLTGESGRRFANGRWEVLKDRDVLILRPRESGGEVRTGMSISELPVEVALPDGSMLQVRRFLLASGYPIPRSLEVATLDAGCVEFPLVVRPWRAGDKLVPFGMKGRKKLVSDLLTDLKLSRFEKEGQLVVADACGRILWVVGRRTDECARVTERTREVVEMRVVAGPAGEFR